MANQVKALVVREGNIDNHAGRLKSINCTNSTVHGIYWRKPNTGRGIHTGYTLISADNGAAKPTPDSLKVLHVRDNVANINYYVALGDSGSVDTFTDRCNACCDDLTPMPTVVVPDVVIEENACPDGSGNRNFFSITDALAAGEIYDVDASLDGTALSKQDAGFASLAAIETYGDANWSPATVAVDGSKVTLTSATAETGALVITVKKKFESNAPGALTATHHWIFDATINGAALPTITGVADGDLAALAVLINASADHAYYGRWSTVGGKIRLVSGNATSATLVVTMS